MAVCSSLTMAGMIWRLQPKSRLSKDMKNGALCAVFLLNILSCVSDTSLIHETPDICFATTTAFAALLQPGNDNYLGCGNVSCSRIQFPRTMVQ